MSDEGRLAISVTHTDGTVTRWGYDEVDGGRIPTGLSFSTSTPGGFKDCSCSLLKDLPERETLYDDVRVYGPGGQAAWEGRIAALPRQSSAGALSVVPQAIGWSAHLEDYQGFRAIYVDRDPGSWGDSPLGRRVISSASGEADGAKISGSIQEGGLRWEVPRELMTNGDMKELWYQGVAGVTTGYMVYRGQAAIGGWTFVTSDGIQAAESPVLYGTNDWSSGAAYVSSPTLTFDNTIRAAVLSAPKRSLMLRIKYQTTVTNYQPAQNSFWFIDKVAVYGDHGVVLVSQTGEPDGVSASSCIAHALANAAPNLNYTTGTGGTIQDTTFAVPHLTFKDPTTAADVISRANAYHGWDWLVWEDKTFYYQPAGSGTTWEARLSDGAELSLEGDTAEQIINGVIVSYQDGGISKLAGPVGSGCDVESALLQDASADNPVNMHGIAKKWPVMSLSAPSTDAGAVQVGQIYVAERNLASRRGQLTVTGLIRDPYGNKKPVWMVRAGDTVNVTDEAGDKRTRRIVETSYTHASRTNTLTLDSTAHKLDALMERIAVVTESLR